MGRAPPVRGVNESRAVRGVLIGAALLFLGAFLVLPLAAVLAQAFARGARAYVGALTDPDAVAAIRLTLLAAVVAVPINVAFGLAAAWAIARFRFRGRTALITLIDLPFAVSPVIAGMLFVLVYGVRGWLGSLLDAAGIQVVFGVAGIVLATMFVTVPFVARELIPLMEEQGSDDEEAALVLGASGWEMFRRVTLPNIRWGLLYGVVLCSARAIGEFGAVSVVSGHIRGETVTLPLHVEIRYNEYDFVAAFAVASALTGIALVTLAAKTLAELRLRRAL
jgi:sulfate/thiosulfate transport system permease protein